ncbi:MAG: acyl carrier protein [Desulfobacteraceae bacterium]|nr:acyl carrier protein [Desulfobacteraceae bacterium]MCF8094283.1 acyl carrier protein [Desulfobacteraceae bacterium]
MDKDQIFNDVIGIIKEYVKDKSRLENVDMDTSILDDLKVNSARLVDIIIQFEDTFDIEIEDDDADNIRTIGDAVNYIAGRLQSDQTVK